MPFSSGSFSLYTPGNPVTTGTTIASSWANNTLNDIATGLSTCVLKDGTQTITANLPMAGFKLTGLGAGSAAGDSLRYEQVFLASTAISAAGSGQSDATSITSIVNQVTTVASGAGVKVTFTAGYQVVYNGGANPLKVYPPSGGSINQLVSNAAFILPVATAAIVFAASSTIYIAIMSR